MRTFSSSRKFSTHAWRRFWQRRKHDEDQSWDEYINAAIGMATYKVLDDDGTYYGEIPGLQGVWANADTLEECRQELREVLEGWIELGLVLGHDIPDILSITPMPKEEIA